MTEKFPSSRVKKRSRSAGGFQDMRGKRFRFGDYEADFGLQELRKRGTRIGLQHKPFHVLELLLRNPGQLVTRKELVAHLWPDSHVSFERGLNSAVNSLRLVLGESSRECHYIETRPGLGYRFIAPVEEIAETNSMARRDANREAYEDCLKGRYLLDRMTEEEIHKALAYFHSATGDETCLPLAHAGIADAYCQLALIGSVRSSKVSASARSSAEVALRRDPDLPNAHVSSGRVKMLFDWDWKGARKAVSHALELDAVSVPAHTLHASLLCTLGDYEAALEACRAALSVDPLCFPANLQLAACLYAARDFQAAVNQCWKMLSLSAGFAPAQLLLALAYEQLGMYEEAIVEFQNAQLCSACGVSALGGLSEVFAVTGQQDESEQAFRELSAQASSRYVSSYWHAVVYAGRRQQNLALSHLEQSVEQRDPALLWLKADARFDSMRQSPGFRALLERVGI